MWAKDRQARYSGACINVAYFGFPWKIQPESFIVESVHSLSNREKRGKFNFVHFKYHSHSEQESNLPWINEFLETGQTEQSWHEVIGCWTIAGWLTEWLTGKLSERLFGSLKMQGKAMTFFSPQGGEVTGLTIPDQQAQKGTRELGWNVTTFYLCFLISLAPSFLYTLPQRLPWISMKGSFMDLRVQVAVKLQHLQNKDRFLQSKRQLNHYFYQRCRNVSLATVLLLTSRYQSFWRMQHSEQNLM